MLREIWEKGRLWTWSFVGFNLFLHLLVKNKTPQIFFFVKLGWSGVPFFLAKPPALSMIWLLPIMTSLRYTYTDSGFMLSSKSIIQIRIELAANLFCWRVASTLVFINFSLVWLNNFLKIKYPNDTPTADPSFNYVLINATNSCASSHICAKVFVCLKALNDVSHAAPDHNEPTISHQNPTSALSKV